MRWNSVSGDPSAYRRRVRGGAGVQRIVVGDTDLWIAAAEIPVGEVTALVGRIRADLARLCTEFPPFLASLAPVDVPSGLRPGAVARAMLAASRAAEVGPMAAVAGAIAEEVCRRLARVQDDVVVENGGDIFMISRVPRTVAVYAGDSPLSMRLGVRLAAAQFPCGVCTSSGTVGPSLSFGNADAALVVASSGALADAVATALGNRVVTAGDLECAVSWATTIPGVSAALAVAGDALAAKGALQVAWIEEEGR